MLSSPPPDNLRQSLQNYLAIVIPSPNSPALLGLPWLKLYNPYTDWIHSQWEYFLWLPFHTISHRSLWTSSVLTSTVLFVLFSSWASRLRQGVCKQHTLSPPPLVPYEYTIDLPRSASLHTSRLYTSERGDGKMYSQLIGSWVNSSIIFPCWNRIFLLLRSHSQSMYWLQGLKRHNC